jgi:hypothetical protein
VIDPPERKSLWQEIMDTPVVRLWSATRVWVAFLLACSSLYASGLRFDQAITISGLVFMLFSDLHRLKWKDKE